jgi:hypothetical protein
MQYVSNGSSSGEWKGKMPLKGAFSLFSDDGHRRSNQHGSSEEKAVATNFLVAGRVSRRRRRTKSRIFENLGEDSHVIEQLMNRP